jgi:archaellum component FlaF (FlaF/FlaG flagellin family)
MRFSTGYGTHPLDPTDQWAGIRFIASTAFTASSSNANVTLTGKGGATIANTGTTTVFANGVLVKVTLELLAAVYITHSSQIYQCNQLRHNTTTIDTLEMKS